MRFSQADSTSSHAGTPWCCQPEKSHDIIILSFCNIVKGQAKYCNLPFSNQSIYIQDTWQLSVNSCFDIDCYSILIAKNSMFKLQCHAITRIDGVLELVIVLARH